MTVECFTLHFSIIVATHNGHSAFHSPSSVETDRGILVLHPESPFHFSCQPTARVSRTLWHPYLSHVIEATT